ncbi:MAG TPA: diacylglycerol kinase family protein [Saprospiraceae bacterium]|nr:diacylglycerol kinase family protein [Saprospiraceae bacterium]
MPHSFWKKRIQSFGYALQGVADLLRSQHNARIHVGAAAAAVAAGSYLHIATWEWVAVLGCIAAVLSLEALNTAVEHLTDLVSPDYHPLAGRAKDVAAAAVLIAAAGAVLIGALIFLPKICALL